MKSSVYCIATSEGQADRIKQLFENQNWVVEAIQPDYNQRQRILIARP